jgi:hypothetical protein
MTFTSMHVARQLILTLTVPLLCAACSKPEPPEKERPPEPQATELRDAIQQPIDRARAAEDQVRKAAAQQRAAIDAQSGDTTM